MKNSKRLCQENTKVAENVEEKRNAFATTSNKTNSKLRKQKDESPCLADYSFYIDDINVAKLAILAWDAALRQNYKDNEVDPIELASRFLIKYEKQKIR